jgi:hypothetical protein
MFTVVLTERQAATIAAGLAALLRRESVTKEDQYFLTADYTLAPLKDEDVNALKILFTKASISGMVDQPPPEPTRPDAAPSGMRMRG